MCKQPKYKQIMNILISQINIGKYQPGDALPSENDLMEHFEVSRITVRRTMDELYHAGYIEKKQGKRSFVREAARTQELNTISSYTEEVLRQNMVPSRKVVKANLYVCNKTEQENLMLHKSDVIFRLERVIYADQQPFCYTITSLPYKLFPNIEAFDYTQCSLYHILQTEYDTRITTSHLRLKAVPAKTETSMYLDVENDTPLLFSSATTYGIQEDIEIPIEYFNSYYLTNRFEYTLTQSR